MHCLADVHGQDCRQQRPLEMDPGMAQHTDVQNASQPNGQNATNAYFLQKPCSENTITGVNWSVDCLPLESRRTGRNLLNKVDRSTGHATTVEKDCDLNISG